MSPSTPPLTSVLVVVPAHDEEDRIGACVASVGVAVAAARSARPDLAVSVTVALDRCSDATETRALAAGPVQTVRIEAGSVGAARAAGVAYAVLRLQPPDPAGVLVVNTDADCVVPPDWLLDHVRLATDHDLVLGEVRPDADELTPGALATWWERHPVGRGGLHGANLSVRLDAYLRAGGFPPVSDREDALLVRALRAQGARVTGGTRVVTSARRDGRTPDGFAGYLRRLDQELVP